MEHIAAIMLLVGCSHGSLACEELPAPQVAFETLEECVDALPASLGGAAGADRRVVHGRCASVDPAWIEEDVEIGWRMTREKGLEIDIRQVPPPVKRVIVAQNTHRVDLAAALH